MTDQTAAIITPDPPGPPTVGARPYWLPDTRGFLAGAIVVMISVVVITLLWHPIQVDEKMFTLLTMLLGILVKCFTDVYGFSFNTTQEGAEKNKTIASLGTQLGNSVPAPAAIAAVPGAPSTDSASSIIKP